MHVLLTGATGVIGSAILEDLLRRTDAAVTLLVRAPDRDAAEHRRDALLDELFGRDAATAVRPRAPAVPGDVAREHLGMSAADRERLAGECTHLVHCAAQIRMNLPREAARSAAVAGTRHLLDFARSVRDLRKIEVLSTIGVGGRLPDVPEDWIEAPRAFHNTYEEAKAEAETLLRRAAGELPLTVHRPSMVVGDARTGRVRSFQVFYHLCEFLAGVRSRGLVPRLGDARLDTFPIDRLVAAVHGSLGRPELAGRVLHECSGADAIRLAHLQEIVRGRYHAAGVALPPLLPLPGWAFGVLLPPLARLAPPRLRRAIRTAPIFLDYLSERRLFRNERTMRDLAAAGLAPPPPAEYLPRSIDYYLEHRITGRGGA